MSKKSTGAESIPRLIRCAFNEANLGNEEHARSLWKTAVERGYVEHPKTKKGLEIAIQKGLRDRGIVSRHS